MFTELLDEFVTVLVLLHLGDDPKLNMPGVAIELLLVLLLFVTRRGDKN